MNSETSSFINENLNNQLDKASIELKSSTLKDQNLLSLQKFIYNSSCFVKVTQDGLILKKTTLQGFGKSNPSNGEEVFVNYIADLEDGRLVDNTLIMREPKQILMGRNNCVPGLELGIKSMVIGEKAKIIVFPEYGYILHDELTNKNKSEQNPNSKPFINNIQSLKLEQINYPSIEDSKSLELKDLKKYLPIIYDIELVKIDKPRKNRENADVTEKMTEASDLKIEGNQLFREKRYREALLKYSSGLNYFYKIPTDDLRTNKLIDLKHTLILNIINSHNALFEYNYALKRLPEAFEIKDTPKCYFYRALASMNLAEFEQAHKDIEKLKSLMPNDKQILRLEDDFKNLREKTNTDKKSIFKKGIFMEFNNPIKYDEKIEKNFLPSFNQKNFCFYFDILINNNTKAPQKIKFEIFDIFAKTENEKSFIKYFKNLIRERKLVDKNLEIICDCEDNKKTENFLYKITEIESEKGEDSTMDLLQFLDYDNSKYMNNFQPSEDSLLAIKKKEDGKIDLVIIPFKITDKNVNNLHVIGRLFYNNENFNNLSQKIKQGENLEIRIIDCDKSFNL